MSWVTMLFSSLLGKISILEILILSPEHSTKNNRILCRQFNSEVVGSAKIATSSAYNEQCRLAALGRTSLTPFCASSSIIRWSRSMARMKRREDRGPPCLRPRACLKLSPGQLFPLTLEVEVARMDDIQFPNFLVNRNAWELLARNSIQSSQMP